MRRAILLVPQTGLLGGAERVLVDWGGALERPVLVAERLGLNAQEVVDLLERRVLVEHRPAARGDVKKTCADCSLAAQELGVVPSTPLVTGLAAEVEWMLESRHSVAPGHISIASQAA
jgi:hypothetical protein